jgi:hypothetical protein
MMYVDDDDDDDGEEEEEEGQGREGSEGYDDDDDGVDDDVSEGARAVAHGQPSGDPPAPGTTTLDRFTCR